MPRKGTRHRPWGILALFVADFPDSFQLHNLDAMVQRELDQVAYSVDLSKVNLAIQVDFKKGLSRRVVVGKSSERIPESNSGDPEVLKEFLKWGIRQCPADRYEVVLWGHSFGPEGFFPDVNPTQSPSRASHEGTKARQDDEVLAARDRREALARKLTELARGLTPRKGRPRGGRGVDSTHPGFEALSLGGLSDALLYAKRRLQGRPVDIIVFKNCFVSTLETAFELHGVARFMIAAQNRVPAVPREKYDYRPYWPYANLAASFRRHRKTEDIARALVRALGQFYLDPRNRENSPTGKPVLPEVPYALLDLDGVTALTRPMRRLTKQLVGLQGKGGPDAKALDDVMGQASQGDPALVDVKRLCDGVRRLAPGLAPAADKVKSVITRRVVLDHRPRHVLVANKGLTNSSFNGVGVMYCRVGQISPVASAVDPDDYAHLKFSKATGWHKLATSGLTEYPAALKALLKEFRTKVHGASRKPH